MIQIQDALGGTINTTYDSHVNKLTQTDPKGKTKDFTLYDAGRLLKITDSLGNDL